jgi:subtilase family serine protease
VTTLTSGSGWVIAGGTSLSTPQWAGLVAVANAVRAASGKPVLGPVNAGLYRTIGGVSATYASTMLDVKTGSNGSCKGCAAVAGYDLVTGFGTPNAGKLLDKLVGL